MSPLECDWRTKPIIYIINNSLAFRYVTSQIWKYYGIFGFVPNERGRIHEHKAPFRKQLSAQAFKVYSFVNLCERRVQNRHMVTVKWALFSSAQLMAFTVLLLAVIKQRCITAGAPFWIKGELPVFVVRPHAPNRDARTMTVRYEYMCRATPCISCFGRRGKKRQTWAGNSDKLSDTGRARAWASQARVGLGPKFEARAGL